MPFATSSLGQPVSKMISKKGNMQMLLSYFKMNLPLVQIFHKKNDFLLFDRYKIYVNFPLLMPLVIVEFNMST